MTVQEKEKYKRMEAALKNILEISSDEFCLSQARYGLNIKGGRVDGNDGILPERVATNRNHIA